MSRDLLIVIVLFVILIGFTVVSASRRAEIEAQQETFTPYSTRSALPNGTLALTMWLEAMGFRTQRLTGDVFALPAEASALFVFPPRDEFTNDEAQIVLRWVERGNTLFVAQSGLLNANNKLNGALKAKLQPNSFVSTATPAQPLNGLAPTSTVQVRTAWALDMQRDDFVPYLGEGDKWLLVGWTQGKGKVYLTSAPNLFTNDGLRDDDNATLVRALLRAVPRGSLVALDEFHLTPAIARSGCAESLQSLLYCTPWGWAILFSFVAVFAFLVINGQRFGRVVPLPTEIARRNPAEYVLSMAQLFRRAGKRQMVMQHYHQQLKRSLGKPYRINANLPDDEFVNELARFRDVDRDALLKTLRALSQTRIGEGALVKLADEAIKLRRATDDG
ncbi:MAG: DUF4350 domain-containing protein [Chloroflexota bacterium]